MQRRTWTPPGPILSALAILLVLCGCGSENRITEIEGTSNVTLSLNGLQTLGEGLNYQAWLVHQSGSNIYGFPLVLFNINGEGQMVDPVADTILGGPFHSDLAASAVLGVAISLEMTEVLVAYSSYTLVLSGEAMQGTADLSAQDWLALNRDFSNAAGRFILATPTDEEQDNDFNGLWFLDPTPVPVEAGLVLPEAPNGWTYEGWIEVDGQTLSTGKFVFPNLPDSADSYSGTLDPPPFPGEDFLFNAPQGVTFPLDLSGASVFVTIEPWQQWDVELRNPFFLRILEGQVPANPTDGTAYQMNSLAAQLPTGTATIEEGS